MAASWGEVGNKLISDAKKRGLPVVGQLELTARCNLQCKMCYVCRPADDKSVMSREKSAKEWIHIAEETRDTGVLYLLLTGGEVFLRQDFKEIYTEISRMGFCTTIYTNATMVTPEIAKWLGKIPPGKVSVTLYGASPETYGEVCGHADGFSRTLRGIDLLLAEGINVDIRTTMVCGNSDDFEKIAELSEARGLNFGITNYITPRREGNYTNPTGERLSVENLGELGIRINNYLKKIQSAKKEEGKEVKEEHIFEDAVNPIKINTVHDDINNAFSCSAGKSSFWITWDGKMTPCGLLDDPLTYPLEHGVFSAWNKLRELCGYIPGCSDCNGCSLRDFCSTCPAKLKTETGHYDKPAPYLCALARKTKEIRMEESNAV